MNLLFLDIDGVMTCQEAPAHPLTTSSKIYPFSETSVHTLNTVLKQFSLKIILTSSWRTVFDVETQCQIFRENGVVQVPQGQTESVNFENRTLEISRYLGTHPTKHFVILDDMEIKGFEQNFVRVPFNEGLTPAQLPQIQRILSQ